MCDFFKQFYFYLFLRKLELFLPNFLSLFFFFFSSKSVRSTSLPSIKKDESLQHRETPQYRVKQKKDEEEEYEGRKKEEEVNIQKRDVDAKNGIEKEGKNGKRVRLGWGEMERGNILCVYE